MKSVPIYEAKNRLSELVAAVEKGETVAITRRGRPVARLVADTGDAPEQLPQRQRAAAALAELRRLRHGRRLEGDPKAIAREGLD